MMLSQRSTDYHKARDEVIEALRTRRDALHNGSRNFPKVARQYKAALTRWNALGATTPDIADVLELVNFREVNHK